METRAIWEGTISFGLVQIPVGLHAAESRDELDFDRRDMGPVGYQKYNRGTHEPVEQADIVKGYEYAPGEYVTLEKEDFKRANATPKPPRPPPPSPTPPTSSISWRSCAAGRARRVIVWDRGRWLPEGDPDAAYHSGHLKFRLEGEKLRGGFSLVRMHGRRNLDKHDKHDKHDKPEKADNWLLLKQRDDAADEDGEVLVRERTERDLRPHRRDRRRQTAHDPAIPPRRGAPRGRRQAPLTSPLIRPTLKKRRILCVPKSPTSTAEPD